MEDYSSLYQIYGPTVINYDLNVQNKKNAS